MCKLYTVHLISFIVNEFLYGAWEGFAYVVTGHVCFTLWKIFFHVTSFSVFLGHKS